MNFLYLKDAVKSNNSYAGIYCILIYTMISWISIINSDIFIKYQFFKNCLNLNFSILTSFYVLSIMLFNENMRF